MKEQHHTADKDLQIILGGLLRTGVIASMVVVLIGGVMYLFEHASGEASYGSFSLRLDSYASIPKILDDLVQLRSTAIIQFGILLLIFTPILRVVFSIYSFLIERDYMYVVIGLIVLAIIMISLNGKLAH